MPITKNMAISISQHTLSVTLFASAAALALWTVVRFPGWGPKGVTSACVHVVLAYLGGLILADRFIDVFVRVPFSGAFELAVVGGALPPSLYLFVSIAWFIRSLQGLLMRTR